MKKHLVLMAVILGMTVLPLVGVAGDKGTKEEAVAMVKKAIEYAKANGIENALA
jgi:hypothetical protein